ncbi:MAG TPA: response regulator transcription factor [Acidimicrobiia bacterium]|jgi:two-component system OmpR family response regulator|nr:response regulator transcription factor [Acidimicrobiia bacterium]
MRLTIDPQGVRILVVDDEDYITDLVAVGLRFVGFEVDIAQDGREALAKVVATRPDLIVLDISMPGLDGLDVIQRLRRDGIDTPVVFLTARDAPADRVRGLHLGADDYITKPFSLEELLARIEAILRRVTAADRWPRQIVIGDLTLDSDGRSVIRREQRIDMSRLEFNVLEFLMMNAGRVVSKQQILEHVWQYDFGGESTVVETYISYLRKKLDGLGPPLIHTMRGVGYVLRNPDEN